MLMFHLKQPFYLVSRKDIASDRVSLGKWDVIGGRKVVYSSVHGELQK